MVAADDGIELTQNGNRTAVSLAGKTRLHASDAPARFIVQAERIKGGTNFGRSFLLFKTEFRLGKNGMTETDDVATPMELKKNLRDCADLQPTARNRLDRFGAVQTLLTCQ